MRSKTDETKENWKTAQVPGCSGTLCRMRFRLAEGSWSDVELVRIETVTLDFSTRDPIDGTTARIAPDSADRYLLAALRELLGFAESDTRPEEVIIDYGACGQECYCHVPPSSGRVDQSSHEEMLEWTFQYDRIVWLSRDGDNYIDKAPPNLPIKPQAHQRLEGPLEMNPGLSMVKSYRLHTMVEAKVKFRLKYKEYSKLGVCLSYPLEGGFPV